MQHFFYLLCILTFVPHGLIDNFVVHFRFFNKNSHGVLFLLFVASIRLAQLGLVMLLSVENRDLFVGQISRLLHILTVHLSLLWSTVYILGWSKSHWAIIRIYWNVYCTLNFISVTFITFVTISNCAHKLFFLRVVIDF